MSIFACGEFCGNCVKNPSKRAPQACSRPTFGVLGWEQGGRLRGTGVERKDFLRVCFFPSVPLGIMVGFRVSVGSGGHQWSRFGVGFAFVGAA